MKYRTQGKNYKEFAIHNRMGDIDLQIKVKLDEPYRDDKKASLRNHPSPVGDESRRFFAHVWAQPDVLKKGYDRTPVMRLIQ
ncbi:hypothetical protein NPIL_316081 [Nephila pilipes]|uniref:Uncharacterized protein n=1 Tax=Nephila pilipes TaxID=299642 RepID=A0A8X6NF32_NEPPI|nr:hypothetical protein NPIL_316081 [Nephila pilipes]